VSVGTEQREVDTVETGGVARLACHAVTFRPPGVAGPGRVFGLSLPASTDGVGHDALPPQVQGTGVRPPDRVVVRDGRRGLVASLGFVLCGMHCETPFGPVRPVSGRTHPRFFESSPVPSEMSGYAPISGRCARARAGYFSTGDRKAVCIAATAPIARARTGGGDTFTSSAVRCERAVFGGRSVVVVSGGEHGRDPAVDLLGAQRCAWCRGERVQPRAPRGFGSGFGLRRGGALGCRCGPRDAHRATRRRQPRWRNRCRPAAIPFAASSAVLTAMVAKRPAPQALSNDSQT